MANAIRVSDGNRWAYIPAGTKHQARLESFATAGMAEVSDGFVLLKHEAGPMFWEMLNQDFPQSDSKAVLDLSKTVFEDRGILPLTTNEGIKFGEDEDPISYNKFADLSLVKGFWGKPSGVFSAFEDGHIVMTVWPESKRVLPARFATVGQRYSLELPESQKKGDRCFVLDGTELITVSFPSDGTDKIRAMNPNVLMSWLVAADAESMKKMGGRFDVEHQQLGQFVIRDKKTGKAYAEEAKTLRLRSVRLRRPRQ